MLSERMRRDRNWITPEGIVNLANEVAQLEAELLAHKENEGDECPLCACEAENERLRGMFKAQLHMMTDEEKEEWLDDALKEGDDG